MVSLESSGLFGSGSGFNQVSGSGSEFGIRIQKGKNDSQKFIKVNYFHVLKCWMVLFFLGLKAFSVALTSFIKA
jgi:hypothetical protein